MTARRPVAFAAALALSAGSLTGCSLAPHYVRPTPPVPPSWPTGDAYLRQSEAALPTLAYTAILRDPRLQALVTQALANNRDVRVAAANLAAARAQVRVIRANQFPEIGVSADATYTRSSSANQTNTIIGTGSSTGITGTGIGGTTGGTGTTGTGVGITTGRGASYTSFAVQGGISSFEVDLFGRLANATAAQRERALSTEAAARTVRLGLVADIANAWATYAADKDLFAIARDTVASAQRSVTITNARLQGGVAPRTDLRQAEQVLAVAQSDVATQTTALAQDGNLMRLLVGADFDPALLPGNLGQVLASIDTLPAGVSSTVLLRRPDVVQAEYDLRAADADIGVARAELFPTISLSALPGLASTALSALFTGGAFRFSGGGGVNYSIFNAGGRIANVRVTEAQRDAFLGTYEKAIQTAFREVSDALADEGTLRERLRAAAANTSAAADVATLSGARYRFGVDNYLAVLDAQRTLYAARRSEVTQRLLAAQNRVTLYRVLGGDQASEAVAAGPDRR